MADETTISEHLQQRGISRRGFLKLCAYTASLLALPPEAARAIATTLATTPRPSVIWLSFQECTGCTESLTRGYAGSLGQHFVDLKVSTLEELIFDHISLDYHHTLQAAAGNAAERAREAALYHNPAVAPTLPLQARGYRDYVLVVDGSLPAGEKTEYWSTIAGRSNLDMLIEAAFGAQAIIAVGNCASFGGLPGAFPNPSGAKPIDRALDEAGHAELLGKLFNAPGCPPVPEVITGVIAAYRAQQAGLLTIERDADLRPTLFYGATVHETCPRLNHFNEGRFAQSFDDEGARMGHCLYLLGCRGPATHNACTRIRWNGAVSFPMLSGHGCLGCSERDFWDKTSSFYSLF